MAEYHYEEKLGSAPIVPLVFKMALPAVAAQLVNLLYSLVDRIYIGHIPKIGTLALAGVGVTGPVILLISAFSAIVGSGGAPLAAMALGKGDRQRAETILGNGFVLLLGFTAVTVTLTAVFMEPLLRLTGASDATLGYAAEYLSVYLTGTLFVQLATGLNAYINCQGRAGIAMGSVLIGAVLNCVLDPLFIFVFGMGVRGAALATVLAQFCSAAWVIGFLLSPAATLRLRRCRMRLQPKILRGVLGLGISPFMMACTESLIGFVLNGSLRPYGDIYVSTLTVLQSAMQVTSVPMTGFAQGFVPIISYNYGHGDAARVKSTFRVALITMFLFCMGATLGMMAAPAWVASLFTTDAALIAMVRRMLPVFFAGMTIFGLQRACQNTLIALGQARTSLFIALLRKVILLVPLALLLPRWMGVTGVYAAEAVADGVAAVLCTVLFCARFPGILRRMQRREKPDAGKE